MTSCAPIAADVEIDAATLATQTVIAGRVCRSGAPVTIGYVRLLDSQGEFVAEVPLSANGTFRFFARPGSWNLKVLASGAAVERAITAVQGANQVSDFDLV